MTGKEKLKIQSLLNTYGKGLKFTNLKLHEKQRQNDRAIKTKKDGKGYSLVKIRLSSNKRVKTYSQIGFKEKAVLCGKELFVLPCFHAGNAHGQIHKMKAKSCGGKKNVQADCKAKQLGSLNQQSRLAMTINSLHSLWQNYHSRNSRSGNPQPRKKTSRQIWLRKRRESADRPEMPSPWNIEQMQSSQLIRYLCA